MRNKWKAAFFTLLLLLLVIPAAVIFLLFTDPGGGHLDQSLLDSDIRDNQKLLSIHTEKEQVEDLLNQELRKKAPNINVYVNLRNETVLNGSFVAFNQELPYQITFEPEVMDNGDLLLKETDIEVGRFPLPGDEVFTLLKKTINFPDWVDVYPADESILMRVTEMPTKPGYAVKAEEFDLKNNSIKLGVYTKN
jgi:uncharacterized protein YpmS